jgi:hypothetical protein
MNKKRIYNLSGKHPNQICITSKVGADTIPRDFHDWQNAPDKSFYGDIASFVEGLSHKDRSTGHFVSWIASALWFTINVVACPRTFGHELWKSFFSLMQKEAQDKHQKDLSELKDSTVQFFKMITGIALEQPKRLSFGEYCARAVSYEKQVRDIVQRLGRNEWFYVDCLNSEMEETSLGQSFGDPMRVLNYLEVKVAIIVGEKWNKTNLEEVFSAYSRAFDFKDDREDVPSLVRKKAFDVNSGELKEKLGLFRQSHDDREEVVFFAKFSNKKPLIFQVRLSFTCQPSVGKHYHQLQLFLKEMFSSTLNQPDFEVKTNENLFQRYVKRARDLRGSFTSLLSQNYPRVIIDSRREDIKNASDESPEGILDYLQGTIHIVGPRVPQDQPSSLAQEFKKVLEIFGDSVLHVQPCPVGDGNVIPGVFIYIALVDKTNPNNWMICEVQVLLELAEMDHGFLHFLSIVSKLEKLLGESSYINSKDRVEEILTDLLKSCGMQVDDSVWRYISRVEDFDLKLTLLDDQMLKLKIDGTEMKNQQEVKCTIQKYFEIASKVDPKTERTYCKLKTMEA